MNKSTILSFTCLVMINISLEYKSTISNKEIIERDYLECDSIDLQWSIF